MKHLCLWKPAALFAVAALLVAAGTYAQDGEDARGAVEALRTEAVERVTEMLERKMVREVSEARVESDARSIARGLSAEQLDELVRGRDVSARIETMKLRVAVSGGELQAISEAAVGDPESDLLFVPLEPCRIIDTRVAGGPIAAGTQRHFEVAGTDNFPAQGGKSGGCNVPLGATEPVAAAAMINFIAVAPAGPGNLRAWEYDEPPQPAPLASIINYANVPGLNIANGVIVPIAGVANLSKDLTIQADASGTQVVADVTGYFTRFPIEQFQGGLKSTVEQVNFITLISLSEGACHQLNSCTVESPTAGTVIVEGWGQFVVNHTAGTLDRVAIGVETANPVTCNDLGDSINASDYEVPAALGTNADVDFTISHGRSFSQAAGQTVTYRLSGRVLNGANTGDEIENSRLICTFIPD